MAKVNDGRVGAGGEEGVDGRHVGRILVEASTMANASVGRRRRSAGATDEALRA